MPIQFHPNIRNLIVGRGIRAALASTDAGAITILSGVQPSVATLESNWTTYYNNSLLNFSTVSYTQSGPNTPATGIFTLSVSPTSQSAIASGTATWGLIWTANNYTMPTTVPTTVGYIIVPVSDQLGNGVIKLSTTTIVSGTGYTISSLTINIT